MWNAASVRLISVKAPVADAIQPQKKKPLSNGPGFKEFLVAGKNIPAQTSPENVPYLSTLDYNGHGRKVFFEVYGCQMNVNDTEIVWAILKENDYEKAKNIEEANVVLVVTCAIREGAEDRVCVADTLICIWSGILWFFVLDLASVEEFGKHKEEEDKKRSVASHYEWLSEAKNLFF